MMDVSPITSSQTPEEKTVSLKKKRKHKSFSQTEKDMILNTYKYVTDKEAESPIEAPKKNECVLKTAEIINVSRASVYRVLKEHKHNKNFSSPKKSGPKSNFKDKLNDYMYSVIRQKVHAFQNRNELPTLNRVLQVVNDDPELPSFSRSTLYKILKHLKVHDQETLQCINGHRGHHFMSSLISTKDKEIRESQ